jgi:hypothetical protein
VTHHDIPIVVRIDSTPQFVNWMNNVSCQGGGKLEHTTWLNKSAI